MQLKVLETKDAAAWYAAGLRFTCSQCGNCCTGGPGYVWISREEIIRLADHLKLPAEEVVERYCRKVEGKFSLKERRTPQGLYDCIFLKEVETPASDSSPGSKRKVCSIYPVRPLQCRTWPFWQENLTSQTRWNAAGKRCHGINHGKRTFSASQIRAIRDASDWPANPPTSASQGDRSSRSGDSPS